MFTRYLTTILLRDLRALRREVEAYPDDASLWKTIPSIPNSAGTLVLHLSGNLRHYIGAELGHTGYVRDRDAEFATRGASRADLLRAIDAAKRDVSEALPRLTDEQLAADFPSPVAHHRFSTADFLIHLATHLTYHLGQIDYHRRGVVGDAKSVGAVPPAQLDSARPA
ncbi:MAG: hypothetical protein MNPFHGCM_00207 [Gemmatimonadaceae bacterium]|nr:hypothetical protein [Gemmatimonadaceae bacterium]